MADIIDVMYTPKGKLYGPTRSFSFALVVEFQILSFLREGNF